jgi:hypothetical protein
MRTNYKDHAFIWIHITHCVPFLSRLVMELEQFFTVNHDIDFESFWNRKQHRCKYK